MRFTLTAVLLATILISTSGFEKSLTYSEWIALSDSYKRGFLTGYVYGFTTLFTGDSAANKKWRVALGQCVGGMTDEALVRAFDAFLRQDISRMSGDIEMQVAPALAQLCNGKLPR